MAVICETADETAGCITDKSKCCFWKTRLRYVSIGMTSIIRPMVTTHSYFLRAFSEIPCADVFAKKISVNNDGVQRKFPQMWKEIEYQLTPGYYTKLACGPYNGC